MVRVHHVQCRWLVTTFENKREQPCARISFSRVKERRRRRRRERRRKGTTTRLEWEGLQYITVDRRESWKEEKEPKDTMYPLSSSNHLFHRVQVTESTWKCLSVGRHHVHHHHHHHHHEQQWMLRMCTRMWTRNEQRLDYETVQIQFERQRAGWFERSPVSKGRRRRSIIGQKEGIVKSLAPATRQFRSSRGSLERRVDISSRCEARPLIVPRPTIRLS